MSGDPESQPHPFDPWHPDWFMPRCKVCREFEDHRLHPAVEPGACGDPTCPVLHEDPANPIHPPTR